MEIYFVNIVRPKNYLHNEKARFFYDKSRLGLESISQVCNLWNILDFRINFVSSCQ